MDEWKKILVYIHNGIVFSHKKNEILPFVMTWMNLEGIMTREVSQMEKDKYYMISLTCGIEKNPNSYKQRIGAGAGEWGKWVRVVNGTNFKL